VSLIGRALRLLSRRPPARNRVPGQERQPEPRAAHRPAQPIPADGPHLRVLPPRHRSHQQPAVVEAAPVPRPAISRLPHEAHGEQTYDLDARCAWCGAVLAPGSDLADCAACRAMPTPQETRP